MLPIITEFVDGATVKHMGMVVEDVSFSDTCSSYEVVKPKERIPLEAEDWIKDGPWWVRGHRNDYLLAMVTFVDHESIFWTHTTGERISQRFITAMALERRNATSDWMPCWKEKE